MIENALVFVYEYSNTINVFNTFDKGQIVSLFTHLYSSSMGNMNQIVLVYST